MPLIYQSAGVFLHLSKEESFGNVFLEAMACGLPIIAHDSHRLRWIIGEDEFLVDTNKHQPIVNAITASKFDSPARRTERVARASSFSWTAAGKSYRDFLQQVVEMHSRRRR
jgi:glycosyltransferase involved in cell wall biosynthesis